MIKIHKNKVKKLASDDTLGNVISLLERTIIEMAVKNYAAFLEEARSFEWNHSQTAIPLIFRGERQISGVVYNALSQSCPYCLTERKVYRDEESASVGREDY